MMRATVITLYHHILVDKFRAVGVRFDKNTLWHSAAVTLYRGNNSEIDIQLSSKRIRVNYNESRN